MLTWQYLFVMEQEGRARRVNGKELRDWKSGPPIFEFLNGLGEEGWKLITVPADGQAYSVFKRSKP